MTIKDQLNTFYWNHWRFFSFLEDIPDTIFKIYRCKFVRFIHKGVVFTLAFSIYFGLLNGAPIEKLITVSFINTTLVFLLLIDR